MFNRKKWLIFVLIIAPSLLYSQNHGAADELETLLGTPQVNHGQAARFVLEAAGAAVLQDPQAAFAYAMERKWLPTAAGPETPVTLEGLSLLVMRSFGLKGGMCYALFKNPHYAYRELVYKKALVDKTDPEQPVPGALFLQILGRVYTISGREAADAEQFAAALKEGAAVDEAARLRAAEAEALVREEEEAAERRRQTAAEINLQLEARQVQNTRASSSAEGVMISLSNIGFQADSARLEETERRKIREIAEILKTIPGRNILVTGHTALAGSAVGQQQVSQARAQAVAEYLVELGARKADEVTVLGYGASRPVADNTVAEGQARNRRVEITILEQP
jgi:outer membrane protein OmpA-like peptidoglycan-associated protein